MHNCVRTGSFWLSLLIAIQQPVSLRAQTVEEPPRPRMNIAVVEGEGTMNNVRDRKPTNVVVIVRDGNRKPIAGAPVTFTLPAEGASATFADGARTVTIQSDKDGYAGARDIRPNTVAGPYRIDVEARHNDETATAAITQFSMAVESRERKSGKWVALAAVLGGAAAGGAFAVTRNGGNKTIAAAPPAAIGITPGAATVGPPK